MKSLVILASILPILSAPVLGSETVGLRSWSITPEKIGKIEPPRDPYAWVIQPPAYNRVQTLDQDPNFRYLALRRPDAQNISAILRIRKNGSFDLNPSGFAYGPIPSLGKLTPAQADELWGTSPFETNADDHRSYLLKALHDSTDSSVILDLFFDAVKLAKYSVRTNKANPIVWQQIGQ